jgi:hypothetical protein
MRSIVASANVRSKGSAVRTGTRALASHMVGIARQTVVTDCVVRWPARAGSV